MTTIQTKFQILFMALICSVMLAAGMTIWAVNSIDQVEDVDSRRFASLKLADEFRQSSDDLTRMARSFSATRVGRFETYFQDIQDIRAGAIPYPKGYDGIFWDFVINEKRSLKHEGTSNSFEDRMRQLGFSDDEFAKLKEAEGQSAALTHLEATAMNTAKGRYSDGRGVFSRVGVPDPRRALEILFSEEYHAAKASVMKPIREFVDLLEARTTREHREIRRNHEIRITAAAAMALLSFGLTVWAFFLLNGTVVRPLATLRNAVAEFGATRTAIDLSGLARGDEIGEIASGFETASRNIGEYIADINATREELKQNDLVLREREENLQAVLNLSPIGFVLSRPTGEVVMANEAILRMNNLTLEDYKKRKVANRYKDPKRRQEYLDGIKARGIVADFEVELVMEDESQRWVSLSGRVIEFGGEEAVMSWVLDVTERKRAEAELQKSRDIFQALADNLPEFVTMKDTEGRYLFVNKVCEEWTKTNRSEMVGKTVDELYDPEKALFIGKLDTRIGVNRENDISETSSTYADGVTRTVNSIRFPIMSSEGTLLGVGHINHDITEMKEAERAVRENEAKLRELLDSAPIGIGIMDRISNHRLFVNRRLKGMLGATEANTLNPEELTATYVNPEDLDTLRQAVLAGDSVENMEIHRRRVDGSNFWTLQSTQGLGQFQGAEARVVWMVDITALKDAEAELSHQKNIIDTALENMDQGISMFDADLSLAAFNDRFGEVLNFPPELLVTGRTMEEMFRFNAERGEYGDGDPDEQIRERLELARKFEPHQFERTMPDGRVVEIKGQPVRSGGFVSTYSDITERKTAERELEDAYEIISSSINYASNIQRSILPTPDDLKAIFTDHLVIWEPKDVVGGDIYLVRPCAGGTLIFLIDCTGHGVPGAFMTMIATGSIDQALSENPDGDPATIMQRTNQLLKTVLGQDGDDSESDDGFECGICRIANDGDTMTFAGARFELWCVDGQDLTEIRGDKAGIGYRRTPMSRTFNNHEITVIRGAGYYMLSDGLVDQVGGVRRRAFGKRRMKKMLLDYSRMKMGHQAVQILRAFEEFQHKEERRDDITMVGFKL